MRIVHRKYPVATGKALIRIIRFGPFFNQREGEPIMRNYFGLVAAMVVASAGFSAPAAAEDTDYDSKYTDGKKSFAYISPYYCKAVSKANDIWVSDDDVKFHVNGGSGPNVNATCKFKVDKKYGDIGPALNGEVVKCLINPPGKDNLSKGEGHVTVSASGNVSIVCHGDRYWDEQ
jgi:hypothetical protein